MPLEKIPAHSHNGVDSPKIDLRKVKGAPQAAITTVNSDEFSSGGTENLKDDDVTILNNMRDRINELEDIIQFYGLSK